MTTTIVLTGVLPFVVLLASGLAFPVSFFLLRLYRKAVQKGMSSVGGGPSLERGPASPQRAPTAELKVVVVDEGSVTRDSEAQTPMYRRAVYGPWHSSIAYAAAGLAYALVMTAGWLAATGDDVIVWTKVLILFWTYYWPAVLTTLLVAAYDPRRRLQVLGAYFMVFAVLSAIAVARNPDLGLGSLPLYWLLTNGAPTLLLATFLVRPIRAVGPLVLAFLIAIAIGSQSVISVAAANEGLLRVISELGFALGLDPAGVFAGMLIVGLVAFGLLGWPMLRLIGKRYEQKALSDQSITIDALWLLFGIVQSIGLAFEGPLWILTGVAAFIVYKLALRLSLRWHVAGLDTANARTLLLLRVFALAGRSERLFDRLRKHWQHAGSISMIAGPDLVTTTVEPHEFLAFLSGRFGRQFVKDEQDLERRVSSVDEAPDPDGRYRVNEFFCYSDTWQMAMQRLAAATDAVIMDLRSFSASNQGCLFELGQLLNFVNLARVVLLVDGTTDRPFLEATLQRLWQALSVASPNQDIGTPVVRLYSVRNPSERTMVALMYQLLVAADQSGPG